MAAEREEVAVGTDKIACVDNGTPKARAGHDALAERYDLVDPTDADVIVAMGGDGFMLHTLHESLQDDVAVFGMHAGTVGFLMNDYAVDDLPDRLATAREEVIYPLRLVAKTNDAEMIEALAINEVSALRTSVQAANLRISVNGVERLERLVCDGILIATPAGSTAYNLSAHGPVLPLGANLLAVTPISPFRPRRWRGALLPHDAVVEIEVLDPDKRPVAAGADSREVRDIRSMTVSEARELPMRVLFDQGHSLEDRISREQFQ